MSEQRHKLLNTDIGLPQNRPQRSGWNCLSGVHGDHDERAAIAAQVVVRAAHMRLDKSAAE